MTTTDTRVDTPRMPRTDHPAIELTGLVRTFGHGENRVRAVDGVDLRIERGEIVALLGPNGAGKTTTLDMLLGLSDPDVGTVRVLGLPADRATDAGRIAAVLQTGGLLADLTVRETVTAIAGLYGKLEIVDDVLDLTDLTGIAKRRVSKCSGGEQQRVKFALALLPDPDVLVLDEPTAGMDVNARRHFWEVMRQDASAGRTIVFATHYLEEAEQFARRTVVMNHGKIIADAATESLRASLGGRTVAATLPDEADVLIAALQADADITDISITAGRLTARAEASDALALRLLEAGATALEITAPTLESAFGTATAMSSLCSLAASEVRQGWGRQIAMTPLSTTGYVLTKVASAVTFSALSVVLVYAAGLATGAKADAVWMWVVSAALILGLGLLFGFWGMGVGLLFNSDSAAALASIAITFFAFFGNVFMPLDGVMLDVARFTPMYGYAAIVRWPVTEGVLTTGQADEFWWLALNVVVWAAVFFAVAYA